MRSLVLQLRLEGRRAGVQVSGLNIFGVESLGFRIEKFWVLNSWFEFRVEELRLRVEA